MDTNNTDTSLVTTSSTTVWNSAPDYVLAAGTSIDTTTLTFTDNQFTFNGNAWQHYTPTLYGRFAIRASSKVSAMLIEMLCEE